MRNAESVMMDLGGMFWTRKSEMVEEIEELDYSVCEANNEYLVVTDDQDDCAEYILYLGHANTTMWIEKVREA